MSQAEFLRCLETFLEAPFDGAIEPGLFFFFFIKVLSGSFYHGWEGDVKGMEIFGRLPESHFLHMFNSKYVIKDHLFTSPCALFTYICLTNLS